MKTGFNIESLPFGSGALAVIGVYILSMLAIGGLAWTKKQENSLSDFYLAGRNIGFLVLVLTLFATQYSGNTLLGFSGAAYRDGLGFIVSTHFMTAIIVAFLFIAPALSRLSREQEFITPGDYVFYRFRSHGLRIVITLLMVYALCNFTLAQLKTLGTVFEGVSQGRIPMWVGVIGLAVIMLVYESLGGMRSVAWTDVIQGVVLSVGFLLLIWLAWTQVGDLPSAVEKLSASPATRNKVTPPDAQGIRHWLSFILIVGLGGAIYPQAIQRIYAAKNTRILKKSLALMAFMPLATTLAAIAVGVIMAAHYPGLDGSAVGSEKSLVPSETVLPLLCREVMGASALGYWLVVIVFAAILAAVMSTTDSALLSMSSMVTHDLYGHYFYSGDDQAHLTRVGRWITWVLMIPIIWIALGYKGTLIQLLQLKFELLIQCAPAFYLGIHWKKLKASTTLAGIAIGLVITLMLNFSGELGLADQNHPSVLGFHSGMVGLAANLLVCSSDHFFGEKSA
ncbi:MAG: sodium:solute symporter family protein [Nitrospinota bacterium]|nr:sodium:solute symporter family protein [Nitrospinota bacterium]